MAILLLVLALIGLPLFAVAAVATLWAFRQAGLDSAVLMLEFHRLAEYPELAALPLLSAAGLILRLETPVAALLQRPEATGSSARMLADLLAPGTSLLVFAAACAILAPGTAPGHAELLRAGLLVAALVAMVVAATWGFRRSSRPGRLLGQVKAVLGLAWPAAALVSLLYTGWLNPVTVAALVLAAVVLDSLLLRPRMEWSQLPSLAMEGVIGTMPALLILGLAIAWVSIWPQGSMISGEWIDGVRSTGFGPPITWLVCAAMSVIAGIVIGNRLAAMALIAPPAILLAQASGLDLLFQGPGLVLALALGDHVRQRSRSAIAETGPKDLPR